MASVIVLCVVMLNVIELSVDMQSVIELSIVILKFNMPESQHNNTKLNVCSTECHPTEFTWHNNTQH